MQAANCSIKTTPSPAVIDAGQSVAFSGSVSGKNHKTYDWTFNGGSPASSTQKSVTVSYGSAGNFEARLDGTNGKGETCFATETVTVNAVGNEPGCGSCHTGYATDNLAGTAGTLVSPTDTLGNTDGIRLLTAYLTTDSKATPIVPTNKACAEDVVAEGGAADGNPKLYRVSTGHGGLFCESCHGPDLTGTVLSRTADERTVTCKDNKGSLPGCAAGNPTAIIPKGTPVGCGMCHRQK